VLSPRGKKDGCVKLTIYPDHGAEGKDEQSNIFNVPHVFTKFAGANLLLLLHEKNEILQLVVQHHQRRYINT
jgi:hypothetical protein